MEFEKFKKELIVALKNNIPEKFNLEVKERYKENDIRMTGISIMKEGCDVGCVLYVEKLYDRYKWGADLSAMVSDIVNEVSKSKIYSVDASIFSREDILRHTTYRMANRFSNQERLKDVPTRDIPGLTDIVIYPVYEVTVSGRRGTVMVSHSLLDANEISIEEIHKAAEKNTESRVAIMPLDDVISKMVPPEMMNEIPHSPFWVSYDKGRENVVDGATILGAPKVLGSIKEPYYVIPSTTNELLFLPKTFTADKYRLLQLISEVNTGLLEKTEVLSNNLYELDNGKFSTIQVDTIATA